MSYLCVLSEGHKELVEAGEKRNFWKHFKCVAILLTVLLVAMTVSVVIVLKGVDHENDVCDQSLRGERSIIQLWITFATIVPWLSLPSIPLDFFLAENKYATQMLQFCSYAHKNSLKWFYANDEYAKSLDLTLKGKLTQRLKKI